MTIHLERLKHHFSMIPPEERNEAIQFVLGQCTTLELALSLNEVLTDEKFGEIAAHLEALLKLGSPDVG